MDYAYEEQGYIKIGGNIGKDALNLYEFQCPYCGAEFKIGTDCGRYGNIGPFACQSCLREFYATNSDNNPKSPLYISEKGGKTMELPWNKFEL